MAAVNAWLAADSAETTWVWKDLGPFAAGAGTLLAAFVAGWFLSRNSRKTPYDHLEQLVKARVDWPEDLEGRESVDRSIAYALAQIRVIEAATEDSEQTETTWMADRQVESSNQEDANATIGLGTFGLVSVLLLEAVSWVIPAASNLQAMSTGWAAAICLAIIGFGLGELVLAKMSIRLR